MKRLTVGPLPVMPRKQFLNRLLGNPELAAHREFSRLVNDVHTFSELLALAKEMFAGATSVSVYTYENDRLYPYTTYPSDRPENRFEHDLALHSIRHRSPLFIHGTSQYAFNLTPFDTAARKIRMHASDGKDHILIALTESNKPNAKIIGLLALEGTDLSLRDSITRIPKRSMSVGAAIASSVVFYMRNNFDYATSLPGKREFEADLKDLVRTKAPFSVVIFDIDHFKKVNTKHGYFIADYALSEVAHVISANARKSVSRESNRPGRRLSDPPPPPNSLRPPEGQGWDEAVTTSISYPDKLYRWGGEEFILILFGVDAGQATVIADRLRAKVESHQIMYNDHDAFSVTVSAGIVDSVSISAEGNNLGTQVKELANKALQYAKDHGRNQVVNYADVNK